MTIEFHRRPPIPVGFIPGETAAATAGLADLPRRLSRGLAHCVATKRVKARNQRPLVSLTFDDIPDTTFVHGAPILERRGVRGTFYIAGGLCGTIEPDRQLIAAADCLELHRRGHEIGCHTLSHPDVQYLSASALASELDRNRAFFAALAPDLALENFAYPYGRTSLSRKLQAQRRFNSCRGCRRGINAGTIDLGMLKAVAIDRPTPVETIRRAVDEVVRRNGWLILFTHDVAPAPTAIGCTPQFLDATVAYARDSGCDVVTIRDGLRRIGADPPDVGAGRHVSAGRGGST